MIRWNEPEGQGGDVHLASLDASVLRYDGQGQLIVPVRPEQVEEVTREGEGAEAEADVSYSTKGVAAPRRGFVTVRCHSPTPHLTAFSASFAVFVIFVLNTPYFLLGIASQRNLRYTVPNR